MYRLPVVLLIAACMDDGATVPVTTSITPPAQQQASTESYLFTDSLKEIRFIVRKEVDPHGDHCRVERVNTRMHGEAQPLQELALDDVICPCPMPDGHFPAVELMDFDFDGIKDLRIMKAAPDLSHPKHRYWLWDEATHGYRASALLDSVQDPIFDRERQMMSSQWYAKPGHRGGSTYKVVDGRFAMVSNMEKFTEGDHERWVIWGVKDGRFQPVQERTMPLPKP